MKYIKFLISMILTVAISFSFSACSNSKENLEEPFEKIFVGLAIYQKLDNNLNWKKFNEKHNSINNLVSTINNEFTFDEDPSLLFYIYSKDEITSATSDSKFISNTVKDKVHIQNDCISFRFERIVEDTDILIYLIYKLEDSSYYLEYLNSKQNLTNETETIELNFTHKTFSKINLTLETKLSISETY